ncbi:MAG: DUF2975 domain-containing protein [Caryophanon sp.]|nr:DUF2975 domain-containing protein [Caryophanon sp.]
MKKTSTLFLKLTLLIMVIPVLAGCIWIVPPLAHDVSTYIDIPALHYVLIIGAYGSAIAYFSTLFQAFKLLQYIEQQLAFSSLAVQALQWIKRFALAISALYACNLPIAYIVAQADDAPGLIIVASFFVFAPFVIAVFAAVLQHVLASAIAIKEENDLTV